MAKPEFDLAVIGGGAGGLVVAAGVIKGIEANDFCVVFNALFTLANMPIKRFDSTLVSVDYRGYLFHCDFNQMLGIPLVAAGKAPRPQARRTKVAARPTSCTRRTD